MADVVDEAVEKVADDAATAAVRSEVVMWLAEHWDPQLPKRQWLTTVIDSGYAASRWPREWHGRGLTPALAEVVEAEFARVGAPGTGQDSFNLWANTVLTYGSDELRSKFIRPLMLNEVGMCLLYSEPGAGSDLAAVQTTAVRDGDEWIVNGQKVWTSGAMAADYALLIARTDWDQPKHRGITFFFFPMKQPGVEVRPLRQATGDARFNETFLTDARVPDANRLGELNQGWWVLQTALMYERAVMGVAMRGEGETASREERALGAIPTPDLSLVALARELGRNDDPVLRQQIARLHCMRTVNEWNGHRARAQVEQGSSTPLASLGKLAMAQILHYAGKVNANVLGMESVLDGDQNPRAADAGYSQINAYFFSIGGGTDQIQRNIIGERLLGLPREPEVDKGLAFREVRRATPAAKG